MCSRSGLTIDPIKSTLSLPEFTEKYRKERMVELAFEDHRFWDIRRWMIAPSTSVIKTMKIEKTESGTFVYTPQTDNASRNWDDKYYLYPISQKELHASKNLIQNKGW